MVRQLVLLVFVVPFLIGATLSGTIYGPDLGIIEQAIITIEGEVEQVVVVTDGSYALELDAGTYRITVESGELFDEQVITLPQDGSYIRDFIVLPSLDIPEVPEVPEVPEFSDPSQVDSSESGAPWHTDRPISAWFIISLVLGAVLIAALVRRRSIQKQPYDAYERAVIEALITHEGRATQKQIRALVPFSEAKVSLVVSDLAERGVVRTFKQGRRNIVVLQDGSETIETEEREQKRSEKEEPQGASQSTARSVQAPRSDDQSDPSDEQNEREARR